MAAGGLAPDPDAVRINREAERVAADPAQDSLYVVQLCGVDGLAGVADGNGKCQEARTSERRVGERQQRGGSVTGSPARACVDPYDGVRQTSGSAPPRRNSTVAQV